MILYYFVYSFRLILILNNLFLAYLKYYIMLCYEYISILCYEYISRIIYMVVILGFAIAQWVTHAVEEPEGHLLQLTH